MPYQYCESHTLKNIRQWLMRDYGRTIEERLTIIASVFEEPAMAFQLLVDLTHLHEHRPSRPRLYKNSDPLKALTKIKQGPKIIGYASAEGDDGVSVDSVWENRLLPNLYHRPIYCGSALYSYLAVTCSPKQSQIHLLDSIYRMTHWDSTAPEYRLEIGIALDSSMEQNIRLSMLTIHPFTKNAVSAANSAANDAHSRQRQHG